MFYIYHHPPGYLYKVQDIPLKRCELHLKLLKRNGGNEVRSIFNAFKKDKKALVFIDYEYCFYTYFDRHKIKPSPMIWKKKLEEEYEIADIMVFGDFAQKEIGEELRKIRSMTNTIIETSNIVMDKKKDMTDFIMLDYIYQSVESRKDVDTYIIFTGDGHFQSVVKYLIQKKKKVIVVGDKGTMSVQLRNAASEFIELPIREEKELFYFKLIASNMSYAEKVPQIIPTFMSTVEHIADKDNLSKELVTGMLQKMIQKGYINQKIRKLSKGDVKVLVSDWDKMMTDGIA